MGAEIAEEWLTASEGPAQPLLRDAAPRGGAVKGSRAEGLWKEHLHAVTLDCQFG